MMPERIYFDTDAFRAISRAFCSAGPLPEIRDRILLSPISVFEIWSQLTLAKADDVLSQIHAVVNWTKPRVGLLPWPDDALYAMWHRKPAPNDGFTEKMEKAFNLCLAAQSAEQLGEAAGNLKDALDNTKTKTTENFARLLDAARKGPLDTSQFSNAWFLGIARRAKAEAKTRTEAEITSILNAYHEYEMSKLQIALTNNDYNPMKHMNDVLDAEQLIYLNDPSLCFLTCDTGFRKYVKKSTQAARIVTASPEDVIDAKSAEIFLQRNLQF